MNDIYHIRGSMETESIGKAVDTINRAIDAGELIPVGKREADARGFTRQYLWILASEGKELAYRIGRKWYVVKE